MEREDDQAIAQLVSFAEENSADPGAWHSLSLAYSELEQWEEARDAAKRCVALDQHEADYVVQLGVTERELGNLLGALDAQSRALKLEPYSAPANTEMRKIRELRRRKTEAAEKGIPFDPTVDGDVDKRPMWGMVWTIVGAFVAIWAVIWLVLWLRGQG